MTGPDDSHDGHDGQAELPAREVDTGTIRALRNRYRRFVVYALDGRRLSLDDLAEVVAAWVAAADGTMATRADRDRLLSDLHHSHVTALSQVGLVDYDRAADAVSLSDLSAPERDLVEWSYRNEATLEDDAARPTPPDLSAFDRQGTVETDGDVDLGGFLESVERRRQTVTVYAPELPEGIVPQLSERNTALVYEPIPPDGPPGFLLVEDRDGFVGATGVDALDRLAGPRPVHDTDPQLSAAERALLGLFEDTLFASLERQQLLLATREIEDRALRVGNGTLWVGFQNLSNLRAQLPLYRRLADETQLTIRIYGRPDWEPPALEDLTYHSDLPGGGEFWFLIFDGGQDQLQASALVAEERLPDQYYGCWTYDSALIDGLLGWLTREP